MYKIIEKLSDTTICAEEDGNRFILKPVIPEERAVYDKLLTVGNDNFANIKGYTEIGGRPYVVREFVCGRTLDDYIEYNGKIPDDRIREIALDICAGLSAIHSLGIVHRDITPDNIIIEEDGNARIIDFGISRLSDGNKSKDTQILGTVGYAAPEQFGFHQTTGKADIYALGALINYMAEGVLPNEHLTEGAFRKIVLKCTQMDESKRYRDIDEAAAALDKSRRKALIINRIPGFGGSKRMKAIAVFYYISIAFSSLLIPASGYKTAVIIPALIIWIAPVLIISDKGGRIRQFCEKRGLSKTWRIIIKIFLIWLSAIAAGIIIIAVYI
ncbi:MAG: serine/threonine protein kinase [Clostridia bacterium]|nr:serine/threonine protein kinase [Clostridia bacterium]